MLRVWAVTMRHLHTSFLFLTFSVSGASHESCSPLVEYHAQTLSCRDPSAYAQREPLVFSNVPLVARFSREALAKLSSRIVKHSAGRTMHATL